MESIKYKYEKLNVSVEDLNENHFKGCDGITFNINNEKIDTPYKMWIVNQ